MNELHIVAIRDRAIDSYHTPLFVRSQAEALRLFKNEVNNPQSPMNRNPEDFDLYQLGFYDQIKGTFDTEPPHLIAIGKDQIIHQETRNRFDEITRGAGLNVGGQ